MRLKGRNIVIGNFGSLEVKAKCIEGWASFIRKPLCEIPNPDFRKLRGKIMGKKAEIVIRGESLKEIKSAKFIKDNRLKINGFFIPFYAFKRSERNGYKYGH